MLLFVIGQQKIQFVNCFKIPKFGLYLIIDIFISSTSNHHLATWIKAMSFESENSASVLTTEAVQGAKKFTAGWGRSATDFTLYVHDVHCLVYTKQCT